MRNNNYYYESSNIFLRDGVLNKDVYEWIRDNTTPETIVILPIPSKDTDQRKKKPNDNSLLNGDIFK